MREGREREIFANTAVPMKKKKPMVGGGKGGVRIRDNFLEDTTIYIIITTGLI